MSEFEMKKVLRTDVKLAWEMLRAATELYGEHNENTCLCRGQWYALDSLWYKFYPNENY